MPSFIHSVIYDIAALDKKGYNLMLKHWEPEKMPTDHLDGIIFVSDSQEFEDYDEMMDDFVSWGSSFADSKVAYQYGYDIDRSIWGNFEDPFARIGQDILKKVPNCIGLYWVDFTIAELYR